MPVTGADYQARWQARIAETARLHGERMAQLPPGTCDKCYGVGHIGEGYHHRRCSKCNPEPIVAAGIPAEFKLARLINYEPRHAGHVAALEAAQRFLAGDRDLLLIGPVGSGKTRLAASIANEVAQARDWNRRAQFARIPFVLNLLLPGRCSDSDAAAVERELYSTQVLVLDDLGAEQASDYARRMVYIIAEERSDRGHRTVWTTNKTLQQLSEMHDDQRLTSRLAGRCDVVVLNGPDQRLIRSRR